jgi:hypothetical protein
MRTGKEEGLFLLNGRILNAYFKRRVEEGLKKYPHEREIYSASYFEQSSLSSFRSSFVLSYSFFILFRLFCPFFLLDMSTGAIAVTSTSFIHVCLASYVHEASDK